MYYALSGWSKDFSFIHVFETRAKRDQFVSKHKDSADPCLVNMRSATYKEADRSARYDLGSGVKNLKEELEWRKSAADYGLTEWYEGHYYDEPYNP